MEKLEPQQKSELTQETAWKYDRLKAMLRTMKSALVAFSGGVDSTFLLKVSHDVLGDNVLAVIAESETYPKREKEEAIRLAEALGVRFRVIRTKELANPDFTKNPPERCYFCKSELFKKLKEIAEEEGLAQVLDGANFEDSGDYRPGAQAGLELGVRSPLKEVELVKQEIRELSRDLGLPTWNKPAMACLSSRFPYYTEIEKNALNRVEKAEESLRAIGFSQLRVRHHGSIARIEVDVKDLPRFLEPETRKRIIEELKELGYGYVTLDLAGYRTGSMNEPLGFHTRDDHSAPLKKD